MDHDLPTGLTAHTSGSAIQDAVNAPGWVRALGFQFPYDWSNPKMPEHALKAAVLERGRFDDVLLLVKIFGFDDISVVCIRNGYADRPALKRIFDVIGEVISEHGSERSAR